MFMTVGHFDFHFSNEKVPSSKKKNPKQKQNKQTNKNKTKHTHTQNTHTLWSTRYCETKIRILQHNFEQFSCIQKQKICDEISG